MKQRHQPNEFRVSVLLASGNRTSRKYSQLSAAIRFINHVIDKWPDSKVALDVRKCDPWEPMPTVPIPDANRWDRG